MERMDKVESVWSCSGLSDNKHILNTSAKAVDQVVLNEIEANGVTLERLNEFSKSGLHIYKYSTQITIHGQFPELLNNYLCGYKTLFQNKNLSIGVKWQGIDANKKQRIYNLAKYSGFYTHHTSSEWLIYKQKLCKTIPEAIEKANELKNEISKLDTSLFYGFADVEVKRDIWGRIFAVCEICINGILEVNVIPVIEQITNKTLDELITLKAAELKERELENIEFNKKCELERMERERKEAEFKAKKTEWETANKLKNFELVTNNPIANGQIYARAKSGADGLEWSFTGIKKIGATLCQYVCDIDGNKLKKATQCYSTKFTGYLKNTAPEPSKPKEIKEPTHINKSTPTNEIKGVKLINYSDKAIALIGDTKPIKEQIKSLGGRFNMHLTCGAGWVFSKSMESKIKQSFNL